MERLGSKAAQGLTEEKEDFDQLSGLAKKSRTHQHLSDLSLHAGLHISKQPNRMLQFVLKNLPSQNDKVLRGDLSYACQDGDVR